MYFTYILKCSDNSFYTGITTSLDRRLDEHNWIKTGWAKYTSSRRPCEILHFEEFENRSLASKREYEIKKMTKSQKEKIINKKTV